MPRLPVSPGCLLSLQVATVLFTVVNQTFLVVTGFPEVDYLVNIKGMLIQFHHQVESSFLGCFGAIPQQPPEVRRLRLEMNYVGTAEHAGIHLDSPSHFYKDRHRTHNIPIENLIGPGVIINDTEKTKIPLKIFTHDRRIRKGVFASSFADMVNKCKEKFTIAEGNHITFVLNEDGVEIDDEFFSTLTPNTILMILNEGETWNKQFESSGREQDTSAPGMEVSTSKIMGFIEQARASKRKCTNLPGTSAQKLPKPDIVKLGIGWQHYSYNTSSYHQAQHITSLDFSITSDSEESLPDLGSQFTENLLSSTLPTVTCSTPSNSAPQFTAHVTSPATSTPISQTSSNILVHAGTPTVTMQLPNTARKCIICADREIDAVIQPCFHSLCLVCGLQIQEHGRKCPICRGNIENVRSIFYC
ncbi:unnamed protein product [Mytilus edulis]|uniref:Uncharacterized protein n=1 Tax=Mytilus edulis TaxID=6550 RepID=A0A8S3PPU9_MYTED|nr:unnamed protein product [Mytilus edulis]